MNPPEAAGSAELFTQLYGHQFRLCQVTNSPVTLVLSLEREIDLQELEWLCEAVGWSRRPLRRVRRALRHSLLTVGLWRRCQRWYWQTMKRMLLLNVRVSLFPVFQIACLPPKGCRRFSRSWTSRKMRSSVCSCAFQTIHKCFGS